ncbi:MAG: UbiA family prenyltransferase [Natronomonas sp.]
MAISRHGSGVRSDLSALSSQVHPVFMLPPLAASGFGAVLAGRIDFLLLVVHLTAAFAGLYTAHIKDGYVDFHRRGEDDDHPLTATGCRLALAAASLLFFSCLAVLVVAVDPIAGLLTLPGWVIGYLHAPQLDLHPIGATAGYPSGIGFAVLGGYYVQAATLSTTVVAFAGVFFVVLCGIKTIDDTEDYEYDRSIGKRTVAVVLGPNRARRFAYGLMGLGMAGVVAGAGLGVFPRSSVAAPVVFGVVAGFAYRAGEDDGLATMLLIRGSYLFLAVLLGAVWLG